MHTTQRTLLSVVLFATFAVAIASPSDLTKPPVSQDQTWAPYTVEEPLRTEELDLSHFYLTMRDGVKIAVTLYLPRELRQNSHLPTIFESTRYMRAYDLRWPFNGREAPGDRLRTFLANGYACLVADSRGSGASFGRWPCPWAPDEVKDYGEICDWIVAQPWSDGAIALCGISYDGTTAEMTATNVHPAIKALVPEFSLFDAYTDVAFPGGIFLSVFSRDWSVGNDAIDKDEARKLLKGMEHLVLKGVKPVDDDKDGAQLRAAIESHQWNGNVFAACSAMNFKDDFWLYEPSLSLDEISPSGKIDDLMKAGIPIYSCSGWFDGAYQHSAIKRYLSVPNPGSKLLIGPWSHAGRYNCNPYVQADSSFDRVAELLRFFDHYIKGKPTGIESEPPIHYYTMVEEKWKACESWPPAATNVAYYLSADRRLNTTPPTEQEAADAYTPDYTAATGTSARWNTLLGGTKVTYPDRADEDEKLLTYTTDPLTADTEVTGHPEVLLYVQSAAADGQFFAYLEDVDEDGHVHYVTEGELRALCRKVSDETPPYTDVVAYRSYLRKDAELLTPGETTELRFSMLPTSYLFKAGHRIRIAFAGADKDHFQPPYFPPAEVSYLRNTTNASRVLLPVVAN